MWKKERISSSQHSTIAFPVGLTAWGLQKRAVRLFITPETSEYQVAVIFLLVTFAMYTEALPKVIWMLFKGSVRSDRW